MRFKQGQEWSPDIHIPARLMSAHPHSLPPPTAKDPASTGPQQRGLLLPHAPSHVDGGGGEVAVPSGLRQHGAGGVLWPVFSTLKTPSTYSEQVHQARLSPLESETF